MRKWTLPGLLVVLLLLLAGCQTVAVPVPVESGGSTNNTGITILRAGTGDSGEGLTPHQTIIEQYEIANPDVLVQLEAIAGRDYYTRILTQIAADRAPDVMNIGDDAVPSFAERGAFVSLDACLAEIGFDTSVYLPGLLDPGMVNGELFFLPKDYSTLAVYYNKTIFDEAGVPYPEDGWTWDDLLSTAQALTQDTDNDGEPDIWGIQLPANWTTGFEYWVAAAGGSLISEDGTSYVGYMDSPEAIRAATFYRDLYNTYQVAPPPADFSAFGGGNSEFDNGQAAMRLFGRWPQSGMLQNPNIELGVVGTPADAQAANILFWGGFGISSTTDNLAAACDFLSYYAGPEAAEVWKDWALPAVTSVAEMPEVADDPFNAVWIDELNDLQPRAYTFTPYWNESADPALRTALETLLLDPEADVATVMETAAAEAQEALDELLNQ
ncbi:extracellular solute-binding protein [bacterium]|nr:extracellular solute-binding protein [bacterium]